MGVQKITLLFFTSINLVPFTFTFIHVVPFTFIHLGPGTWYFLSPVLSLFCLSSSSPLLLLPCIASKMIMVKVEMVSGGNTKSQIPTMLKSVSFIYLIVQLVPNLNSSAN